MGQIEEASRQLGRYLAQNLDTNRDGTISGREQVQTIANFMADLPVEARGEIVSNFRSFMQSPEFQQSSPEFRQQVTAGVAVFEAISADPAARRAFCSDPRAVEQLQNLQAGLAAVGNLPRALNDRVTQMTPDEVDAAVGAVLMSPRAGLGARSSLGIVGNVVLDQLIHPHRMSSALNEFAAGFREAAPGGVAPIAREDVCHGLPATSPPSGLRNR